MTHHNFKHGQAIPGKRGPTYRSWECMKSRCNNPNDPCYSIYGGRGIAVADAWSGFAQFLSDMGERPEGTTLDRIDVNKGYEPGNCRWATAQVQASNKRSNVMVFWHGEKMTLMQLSRLTGVPYQRINERYVRRGWSLHDAVVKPPRGNDLNWRSTTPAPNASEE